MPVVRVTNPVVGWLGDWGTAGALVTVAGEEASAIIAEGIAELYFEPITVETQPAPEPHAE